MADGKPHGQGGWGQSVTWVVRMEVPELWPCGVSLARARSGHNLDVGK